MPAPTCCATLGRPLPAEPALLRERAWNAGSGGVSAYRHARSRLYLGSDKVGDMTLGVEMITFDCADPDRLADWWAQAVDGTVNALAPGQFVLVLRPKGPRLGFQKVDEPTPGKNRVHVDFSAADLEEDVDRLVSLGATETGRHEFGDDYRWVVLADPDGNAFCVAQQ